MAGADSTVAQEVITEVPSGARPYQTEDVAERPQGPRSPGGSEPGAMGAFDDKEYEEPQHESPEGNGKRGYRGS